MAIGFLLWFGACGGKVTEMVDTARQAVSGSGGGSSAAASDPVPCAAWSYAVVANTGNIIINSGTLVDSYQSSAGAYGGSNVGSDAIVQGATTITNNGGVVHGIQRPSSPAGFSVVPVPAGATNLPLGAGSPGSLNINTASQSVTLAPGNYVAANINVTFPGAINISPAGQVRIWVTGNLNLGGNENLNGIPRNLAFLVTSSGGVNFNAGGALYGMIYAPTSSVIVNSTVLGSVIGSSLSILNSGAGVHFDRSSLCGQAIVDVIPSVSGIATDSAGATKAIFTYATNATSVAIPYGPGNALLDANGAFIASPRETPPQTFVSTAHAPFVATLTGSALTWRIGAHSATASASSTHLPTVSAGDGTKDAVLPDGRKVNLDSTPPQAPTATTDPPVGAPDNGVLTGTLQVAPGGAATYTLPIAMVPSVAGMAPNLSLAYDSQGPDGIAGQGWSLQGLSVIHKCPRTLPQDGAARPVTMAADPSSTSGTDTDGICLDGQRLFEGPSAGLYVAEKKDFSTITYVASDNHFEVKTKAGEIRYYGLTSNARVMGHGLDPQNNATTATAVWALERVNDAWGNFYSVAYNLSQADFTQTGLRVTEIDYTGHMTANGVADTAPYARVKFDYEPRPDIRWMRFAQSKFPMKQRLKTITTGRGTYTLTYKLDDLGVVSELQSIHYKTGATDLPDLAFGWSHTAGTWTPTAGYNLPSDIPFDHGLLGTQFVDLDGDGRSDLVFAGPTGSTPINRAWLNTGTGWQLSAPMALPCPLASDSGPTGARFADMDGDGVLDFIVDRGANGSCGSVLGGPGVWLNRFAQGHGWEFHSEFSDLPAKTPVGTCDINSCSTFVTIQPISFNHTSFCDRNTKASPENTFCDHFQQMTLLPASLVDVNGDGKMDIVRIEEGGPVPKLNAARLEILINQGANSHPTWVRARLPVLADVPNLDFNSLPAVTADVTRNGLADLVHGQYFTGATVNPNKTNRLFAFQHIALNQGGNQSGVPQFGATRIREECALTPDGLCGGGSRLPFGSQVADVDGDGLYDEVLFGPLNQVTSARDNLATGLGVALNNGAGSWLSDVGDAAGYVQELGSLSPGLTGGAVFAEDFAYGLADLNGDGLPDLIRNHFNCTDPNCGAVNVGGGEIHYNTGMTWGSGSDAWQRSAGNFPLPGVVPSPITAGCGGAFVDLNGDGLVDFIQEQGNGTPGLCNGSAVGRGAWINNASPPVIETFPNGRAPDTIVSYVHITEADAHTSGTACDGVNAKAVYCDDLPVAAGTKKLTAPLRVVKTVSKADGTGNSVFHPLVDTTYAYHSLRADPNGRGPLGFALVNAYDHASGIRTDTTYAQAYPFTGLPTEVVRTQIAPGNGRLSDTLTKYCDSTDVSSAGTLQCSAPGTTPNPRTPQFVYPYDVIDTTVLNHDASGNQLTTESTYRYDALGNSTQVAVTTSATVPSGNPSLSTVTVVTTNQYGAPGSQEELQGKVTDAKVSAFGASSFVGTTSHHTTFAYAAVNTFGGASSTALALAKKEVEPGAGWPLQEDTVFFYDPFGNVVVTTACANDFVSCRPSGNSPSSLPFRTTTVSFNTGSFNAPTGPGLIGSLSYGNGRFPVQTSTTTNNAGLGGAQHVEYFAYDPIKGVLLQKTGQNGIHTCYTYDDLGRPTSEIGRCGSSAPIVSTTAYFNPKPGSSPVTPASGTPFNTRLITVARSASGASTWVFTDYQGKTIGTVARSFGGGFIETLTTYNALGNVVTATKPFLLQSFADPPAATFQTTTMYDGFNRVRQVTEDLGGVGANGAARQLVTTTTYNGLSLTTTRMVNGSPQTRTETKNALGKLQSVVDSLGGEIDYQYDPDGNLAVARTPASILVHTSYDARGRKTQSTDADLGTWNYVFDGFGDLVSQTDANNQQFAMKYDQLGRMQTKQNVATGATAQWIYDSAAGAGIGKLAATVSEADANFKGPCALPSGATVSGGHRAVKTYAYTGFGDLQAVAECADGDTFQTSYEYDAFARQSVIHYPAVSGKALAVGYHYTGFGYLHYLSDDSSDYGVLWQAKAMNAFGQVTDEQTRNGVETVQSRSPGNGWLLGATSTAHSDGNTVIQNWTYTFDEVGNLLSRARADQVADAPSTETFTYDGLNRVGVVFTNVGAPVNASLGTQYFYDGNGNLTQKDSKTYTYGGCQGPGLSGSGLHQVCSIGGGPRFVYDAAGNLTANGARSVAYNAHNKAAQITSPTGTAQFVYGADDNRVVQVATSGTTTTRTVYVGLGGTGKSLYERTTTGTTVQHTNFLYAGGAHGGNAFAVRLMANNGSTAATRYFNFDHLGSTTAVSDEKGHIAAATGAVTELLGYDPWGARRNPDGQPASASSTFPSSAGHRDFTGQETIPGVGLINMNGRVYDPVIGRFLSPDPDIQTPGDLQSYNRYSYALNNPLRYTDPTGYDFWDDVGGYFSNPVNIAQLLTTIVTCVAAPGAGCVVMGTTWALMNATTAVLHGASFEQTALNVAIGVGVGALTSGVVTAVLGPGANPIWGIVAGSASAAATTAISDVIAGRSLGSDVLASAAISAAQGAATFGLQRAVALSQASAQQSGEGSGEERRAMGELRKAMVGDKGPDLRLADNDWLGRACDEAGCHPTTLYLPLPEGALGELGAAVAWVKNLFGLSAAPTEEGLEAEAAWSNASTWDTSLPQTGKVLNVGTDVTATEFQANLTSNGYHAIQEGVSTNGPFTVLSNGERTYTIYTASSTGEASAQVFDSAGSVLKYRLGGP